MALPYKLTKWNNPDFPTEREVMARLTAEGAAPVLRADPPGLAREARRYAYPVTFWVISGALMLQFNMSNGTARSVVLRAGDRLETQPGAWCSLSVPGEGYALYALVTPFCLPTVGMAAPEEQPLPEKRSA